MAMESVFRLCVAMYVMSYVCIRNAACCIFLLLLVQYITAVTCIIERNKITHLDSYRVHFVIFIMTFHLSLIYSQWSTFPFILNFFDTHACTHTHIYIYIYILIVRNINFVMPIYSYCIHKSCKEVMHGILCQSQYI